MLQSRCYFQPVYTLRSSRREQRFLKGFVRRGVSARRRKMGNGTEFGLHGVERRGRMRRDGEPVSEVRQECAGEKRAGVSRSFRGEEGEVTLGG